MPLIAASLEYIRFFELAVALVFEEILEKRGFDVVSIVRSGFGGEVDIADLVAIAAGPTAMRPRTHHKHIRLPRAGLLVLAIDVQRTREIFRVDPAADGHHRRLDVLNLMANRPR